MKFNFSKLFKREYLLLYFFILLGLFLRIQGVLTNSFAFTYDVGRDMLTLWDIVYSHKFILIGATTGLPGVFYGPWWYYFLTPFFILFSANPQGMDFTMTLVGVVSIFLGFILGKKTGGNALGLLVAGLVTVSSEFLSLSAQIWNPNIAPLFVFLTLILLERIYKEKKLFLKEYFLLGLLLSFIIDLEIIFGILFSIGVIISLGIINKSKISLKQIVSFILGAFVIFSPRILFELRHNFLMSKSFVSYFFTPKAVHSASASTGLLSDKLSIVFDQFNSTLAADNKLLGVFILIFIFLTLIFLYKRSERAVKNLIKTCLTILVVFFAGTMVFSHDIWPHYLVGLPVIYVLLFCISLYLLGKRISNFILPSLIFVALFLFILNPISLAQSLTRPVWEGDASVYRNQLAVVDYVYSQAKGEKFKYVVYTPGVNDYVYKYLFKWYGPEKYHYGPTTKVTIAYFILEPDYQDPTRLPDWLKKRSGDGKIIKDVMLKGNIRVQTRIVK